MDFATMLSVGCLLLTGVICTIGVFYQGYQESLAERVGASMIAIWCFSRVDYKLATGNPTEAVHLFLHVGLAVFAVGLAYSIKLGPLSCRLATWKSFIRQRF